MQVLLKSEFSINWATLVSLIVGMGLGIILFVLIYTLITINKMSDKRFTLKDVNSTVPYDEIKFERGVMVLPIQLTKGLEFDAVILWNPSKESYGENEAEAKLLYVAVTRALHELHIVYKDELSTLFEKGQGCI